MPQIVPTKQRLHASYRITFKSGKVVDIHDVIAVDYYSDYLYFSDGDATYTFPTDEIVSSERVS